MVNANHSPKYTNNLATRSTTVVTIKLYRLSKLSIAELDMVQHLELHLNKLPNLIRQHSCWMQESRKT